MIIEKNTTRNDINARFRAREKMTATTETRQPPQNLKK